MEQYAKYLRKSRFDRDYAELSIEETLKRHEQILDKLAQELISYLSGWMILEPQAEGFLLYPAVGKWIGHDPARYQDRVGEEAEDEPLEDE